MSLDVAKPTGVGEEDARQIAGRVVSGLYRLIKGCFLHDDSNQAIVQLVELVVDTAVQFCDRAQVPAVSVLFAANSVFVNRQMLRASRETYQLALELGTMLSGCGVTEVTLDRTVTKPEVAEFGRAVAAMHREKIVSPRFADGGWTNLKVRNVVGFGGSEILSPVTRVARTYAASIMIIRNFYGELKKGKLELSHSVKRVAQKLAGMPEDERRLLLSTAAAPAADTDRAGLIVSSAIVSVVMAMQLTEDRAALTALATSALLYDAGRTRLTRGQGTPEGVIVERILNEEEEERLPTASVIALTALGKLHPPSVTRSVIVYEALSLRNAATPPYGGGRTPHVLSRILAVARAFTELRVARGTSPPLSIDDAIQVLTGQARDNTEKTFVRLLIGTLGVFPAGTLVELSTGELAVVVATPRLPVDFARPPVRIMYDANGALLEEPIDIDLANLKRGDDGSPPRFIRKPIDATDQQMKQMRSYVMALAAKRKARSTDKLAAQALPVANAQPKAAERPPPRRRLSAPQAAIPAGLADLEDDGPSLDALVDIVGPGSADASRDAAARARAEAEARAKADPEIEFEKIELDKIERPAFKPFVPSGPPQVAAPQVSVAPPIVTTPIASPLVASPPPAMPSPALSHPPVKPQPEPRSVLPQASIPTPSVPIPSVVAANAALSSSSAELRNQTRRWDPRSEDEPPDGFVMPPPQPVRVPPPTPSERKASSSTRQVSWDDYGKEIVEAVSAVVSQASNATGHPNVAGGSQHPLPGEASLTDTDALLAAYLTEQQMNESAEAAAARNAGLRWDRGSSAGGSTSGHQTGSPSGPPPSTPRVPVSTAHHSTGHHSTGGHSTGGHSTGDHSTGGHSTGGHSTGGHSAGRDRASAQKGRVGGGLRWDGRSSPGRDIESSAGTNVVERDSTAGTHGSTPSREVDRNVAAQSSQGASSPGGSVGSSRGGAPGRGSSGARGSWGERSSQGGERPSNPNHDPNAPNTSLRGRAKAGSQAWGSSRRDKK